MMDIMQSSAIKSLSKNRENPAYLNPLRVTGGQRKTARSCDRAVGKFRFA